jgi:hypothetical protein
LLVSATLPASFALEKFFSFSLAFLEIRPGDLQVSSPTSEPLHYPQRPRSWSSLKGSGSWRFPARVEFGEPGAIPLRQPQAKASNKVRPSLWRTVFEEENSNVQSTIQDFP